MRVLIINTSELTGGAAIAAVRLSDALNRHGVKAKMLVRDKESSRLTTVRLPQRLRLRLAFLWERFCILVRNRFSLRGLWAVDIAQAGVDITTLPEFQEADVIHLHWVNQGLLSLRQISKILQSGKPVVWTLHDLWPVTGICHHTDECERFHTHCHDCPQLVAPSQHDLSWRVFRQKLQCYAAGRITFVAVSGWTAERARRSGLAQGRDVVVIPNALPLEPFRLMDRSEARRLCGLPQDAAIVIFGAARIDQPLKGLPRLLEALVQVQKSYAARPLHLVLFGKFKDESWLSRIPVPFTSVGVVSDPEHLGRLYAASDVVVCASDYETFGQTLAEAMSCGCIPVSFDRGGQTDIIQHRQNGYLAHYADISDLAAGISWALTSPVAPELLHQSVVRRFGEEMVAHYHIELYEHLLQPCRRPTPSASETATEGTISQL